jgi:hypothetical protein
MLVRKLDIKRTGIKYKTFSMSYKKTKKKKKKKQKKKILIKVEFKVHHWQHFAGYNSQLCKIQNIVRGTRIRKRACKNQNEMDDIRLAKIVKNEKPNISRFGRSSKCWCENWTSTSRYNKHAG